MEVAPAAPAGGAAAAAVLQRERQGTARGLKCGQHTSWHAIAPRGIAFHGGVTCSGRHRLYPHLRARGAARAGVLLCVALDLALAPALRTHRGTQRIHGKRFSRECSEDEASRHQQWRLLLSAAHLVTAGSAAGALGDAQQLLVGGQLQGGGGSGQALATNQPASRL